MFVLWRRQPALLFYYKKHVIIVEAILGIRAWWLLFQIWIICVTFDCHVQRWCNDDCVVLFHCTFHCYDQQLLRRCNRAMCVKCKWCNENAIGNNNILCCCCEYKFKCMRFANFSQLNRSCTTDKVIRKLIAPTFLFQLSRFLFSSFIVDSAHVQRSWNNLFHTRFQQSRQFIVAIWKLN